MASFRCIELPHRRVRIVRCESDDHVLVVPERIDGLMVTEIGDGAFAGLLRVRELDLPSSVVRIGTGAFVNCVDLRRLRFPAGLKDSDPSWLIGCERLEDVALPGAATSFSDDFLSSFLPKRVMLGAKARRFAAHLLLGLRRSYLDALCLSQERARESDGRTEEDDEADCGGI